MKKKIKKVLYTSFDRVPQPKGASIHISQFVRALSARYEVTLLTPGPEALETETYGARHIVAKASGPNYLTEVEMFRDAVDNHIARSDYDLIHFRGIWEGLPATRRKEQKGHMTIFEVNGLPSVELKYHFPAIAGDAAFLNELRSMESEALIESDAAVVPSNVTKNYLISRGCASRKIKVISNGVDTDLFTPSEKKPVDIPVLLYVGTLAPWQGLGHLLEAVKSVVKRHDIKVLIVSKSRKDWLKALRRQVKKLKIHDTVEFVEPVRHREMPDIMRHAHIGVAPFIATERNTRQGFCPIKVLEYMAAGLPVVAPDIEPVKELVRHEKEALLYKPNSMARLRDAIEKLIADPETRETLGNNGRKRAEDFFTWRVSKENLIETYKNLERNKNSSRLK